MVLVMSDKADKIVFINQWASYLTKDIINAFAERYHDVALIAGTVSETGNPLNKKVRIRRIIKYSRKSTFHRQITWILSTIQIIFLVNTKYRKYHLFITSNPPTTAFITAFCRNKYSIQILDIYPDALVLGGFISQDSLVNRVWERRNKKYFAGAKHVFTLTHGMAKTLSKYCETEKIKIIAQWPSTTEYSHIEKNENKFILANSLQDYFIVMYSGNIGLGHRVDALIEAARILKDNKEILFIVMGEGWNKPVIEKKIQDYGLSNCRVMSYQSPEMFNHSLQAADIGVVSVTKEGASLCVPIKTYNLINNQVPLLCIAEGPSELARLATDYDIGKCFAPEQAYEISEYIVMLKNEKETFSRYKKNLEKCSKHFTPDNALLYLENYFAT